MCPGISQNIQTLHTHIPCTGTSFLTGVHNLLCTQYLQVSDEIWLGLDMETVYLRGLITNVTLLVQDSVDDRVVLLWPIPPWLCGKPRHWQLIPPPGRYAVGSLDNILGEVINKPTNFIFPPLPPTCSSRPETRWHRTNPSGSYSLPLVSCAPHTTLCLPTVLLHGGCWRASTRRCTVWGSPRESTVSIVKVGYKSFLL